MAQERNYIDRPDEKGISQQNGPARNEENPDLDLKAYDGNDRTTDEIKESIEETRGQMGETIDAIQEKLSFSNLSEQVSEHVNHAVETAKDAVYGATIGKATTYMKDFGNEISKTSIVKAAKDNPLPFVFIGLGAGLLVYQGLSSKQSVHTRRQLKSGLRSDEKYSNSDEKANAGSNEDTVLGTAKGIGNTVSNAAGKAYDKVSSTLGSVVTGAGDAADQAYGKVGDVGSAAREKYDQYIGENPLAVGAVALALGAAVGMALPATRYEDQMMGQARQDLMDKAQNTATELIDKGKQVVTEAGRTISEKAESALKDVKTSDTGDGKPI